MTQETESEAKRQAYEQMLKEFGENVVTWQDFYNTIHVRFKQFTECHCAEHAMAVLYPMYSFMLALEAMPEEGDIKNIVERMARIMAYESQEELGAEMLAVTPEQMQTAMTVISAIGGRAVREMARQVAGIDDTPGAEAPAPTDKAKLH